MNGEAPTGFFTLRTMIPAGIAVWAATFWFVHGPMVFAYLLLHAATTGVFLTAIKVSDRNRLNRQTLPRTLPVAADPHRGQQRDTVKRAVVG